MMQVLNHSAIPVVAAVEVLVVGAGSAGCCAAIAARQAGAGRVMLAERYGFLGGTSTGILDTFYGFVTPGPSPRQVVGGLPACVVDALDATGSCVLRPNTYGAGTGVTYNPERLKIVWDELAAQAGVDVLLHALLVDAQTDSASRIVAAVFATRAGLVRVTARRFIDASGDAELCHLAGVAYEKAGDVDPAQTLTTTFRMGGVDLDRFEAAGGSKMLAERMRQAVDSGRHPLPRRKGSAHPMVMRGNVATVATRVADLDPLDPWQFTRAEQEGRRQAFTYEAFFRDGIPGYEQALITGLSVQIGVRESRRVYGEYRLTRQDCLEIRRFDDRVLLCGAPVEDHRKLAGEDVTAWQYVPGGAAYDVPYRTLVPKGRDELWVAGRCFSATHDAHASCRSMAQTMAMGQAAGTAAAISLKCDWGARDVPVDRLQSALRRAGAVLETPSGAADTTPGGWSRNRGMSAT
jgi:hypothetical protein